MDTMKSIRSVSSNGTILYHDSNGKLHRVDGPAVEYANGDKCYFLNNEEYFYEDWDRIRKMLWIL